MRSQDIKNTVIRIIKEYLISQEIDIDLNDETVLFGENAILDSMGLVNIVIDLESAFLDEDHEISLTSEKAMSRRQSPFRNISSLVEFISEQIA